MLDSHISLGDISLPETRLAPEDLYRAMRRGVRVSTSQASSYERHKHYEKGESSGRALSICAWDRSTPAITRWRWLGDHRIAGTRMTLLDSGAASGRLAVVAAPPRSPPALASRRLGWPTSPAPPWAAPRSNLLERLEYLARGGRMSKTGAFFGDALHLARVVSPMPDGARRVALLRKPEDKIAFACERAARALGAAGARGYLLAEYTDNRDWVVEQVLPRLRAVAPEAESRLGLCHSPPEPTPGPALGPSQCFPSNQRKA